MWKKVSIWIKTDKDEIESFYVELIYRAFI